MGQVHSSFCSVSDLGILCKSWLLCSEMDAPKEVKGMSRRPYLWESLIISNHTCKILCDIWVKHLDSAEFFIVAMI